MSTPDHTTPTDAAIPTPTDLTEEIPAIIDEAKRAGCEGNMQVIGFLACEVSRLRHLAKSPVVANAVSADLRRAYNECWAGSLMVKAELDQLRAALAQCQRERDELAKGRLSDPLLAALSSPLPATVHAVMKEAKEALEKTNAFLNDEVFQSQGGDEGPPEPADSVSYNAVGHMQANGLIISRLTTLLESDAGKKGDNQS